MANIYTNEQLDAINSRGQNLLVSASAGSGKTAVLVERIIKRIVEENIDITNLLVVTFTKAAAAELKERIYKAVKTAYLKDRQNRHLKLQLKNLEMAYITTIHSFCLDVIRANFYKLGLDPNFSICDDTKSKILKNEAILEVLEEEYLDSKNQEFGLYNVLELFNMDDKSFIESVNSIWDEISCFKGEMDYLKDKINVYNVQDIKEDILSKDFGKMIVEEVLANLSLSLKKAENMRMKLEKDKDFVKYLEVLDEDIFSIRSILNMKNSTWDKIYETICMVSYSQMPRSKVFNESLKDEFASIRKDVIKKEIERARKIIYAKSEEINTSLKSMYKYLEYIYNFIDRVIKRYTLKKNQENIIDFTDIEHFALSILTEKDEKGNIVPTLEAKKYMEEFDEIYIDEYQDTSYMQEAILAAISKENNGNRFMVGDIKQSIYKFRHAAVDIFIDKYNKYSKGNGKQGKKIILAKNFRSRKEVLAGINYIFEQIMCEKLGNSSYTLDEVLKVGNTKYIGEGNLYKTEINFLDFKDKEKDEKSREFEEKYSDLKKIEQEAIVIASRIDKMVNIDKLQVMDMKNEKLRNIKYSDICILLRSSKDKADIYEKALKNANIPVYSSKSFNLFEGDEVNLIISLLKVIDNPLNEIEMLSVMYSVFGQFTLDEIYEIKSVDKNLNIYDILNNWEYKKEGNEEIDRKIIKFITNINKYISLQSSLTIVELLSKIYYETNLYNYALLLDSPFVKKMNLDSLISIAASINQNYNINEFLNYIEVIKSSNVTTADAPKAISENENTVRIMTIHASKGLEFPVVILASTYSKYSSQDMKKKIVIGKYGIGIDCIDEKLKITFPTVIKQAVNEYNKNENKSEELRMLYVALTRAKEKLITYIEVNDLEKSLNSIYISYDENNKIDSSISLTCNSYKDIFMLALKNYITNEKEESKDLFDINHIHLNSDEGIEIFKKYAAQSMINIPSVVLNIDKSNYDNKKIETEKEKINKYISNVKSDELILRRTSVSELKTKNRDEDYIINNFLLNKYKLPNDEENAKISSARKGTMVHYILENFDYAKINTISDVKDLISNMEKLGRITKEEIKSVNLKLIEKFIASSLFREIKNSKKIKKEVEFVLKNSDYTKSELQGVIDLYFENESGNITLVDFKTDNLTCDEEFKKRYSVQLLLYKEAIEKIQNMKVTKVVIYSFKLGREIKITY